jgi:outer membrane protein
MKWMCWACGAAMTSMGLAQTPGSVPVGPVPAGSTAIGVQGAVPSFPIQAKNAAVPAVSPGQTITLDEALALARANEPAFAAALAQSKVAKLDKLIAKAALLPSAVYHNQYLFTESNHASTQVSARDGTSSAPVFIANNAVHEYASQGQVTETLGLAQYTALAHADASSAIATAELEISRRGLTATVVGLFYNTSVAQGKIDIERRAFAEANNFVKQTQEREAAREVAHADVVKAQLTQQQRQRELADAELAAEKARLDLAVLLFPDPRWDYKVALPTASTLPTREATEVAAKAMNPELASALGSLRSADLDVTAARAAYLPDVVFNYTYGVDAAQFAKHGPEGERNLGYSASATLDIPLWDWLATAHKVKQAQILQDSAKVALSATQRKLIADLEELYNEARVAHDQLDSLQLSVDTAAEGLRLTRLRYTNGEATVLEVVDAQSSLTTAELAKQDGTTRYQLALANLQTLTGVL